MAVIPAFTETEDPPLIVPLTDREEDKLEESATEKAPPRRPVPITEIHEPDWIDPLALRDAPELMESWTDNFIPKNTSSTTYS